MKTGAGARFSGDGGFDGGEDGLGRFLPGELGGALFSSFDEAGGGEGLFHLFGEGGGVAGREVEGSVGADVAHGAGVEAPVMRSPLRLAGAEAPLEAPPRLGADTGAVLRDALGLSAERISQLAEAGVIAKG